MSSIDSKLAAEKGFLFSMCSAIFYASAVVFIRFAYQAGVLAGTAIFLRFAGAALALFIISGMMRNTIFLPFKQAAYLFLLGSFAYTILGITWFVALQTSPAWLVSLFVALYPVAINLGNWLFFKDKLAPSQILALTFILLGGIILFGQLPTKENQTGIILMLINVLVNTAYILVGQNLTKNTSPLTATFWITVGASCGTFIYAISVSQLSFSFEPIGWLWIALFAIVSTALAITFLWLGVSFLGVSKSSIIGSAEPVFSIMLSVIILGEKISLSQMVGGFIILVGSSWVSWQTLLKKDMQK